MPRGPLNASVVRATLGPLRLTRRLRPGPVIVFRKVRPARQTHALVSACEVDEALPAADYSRPDANSTVVVGMVTYNRGEYVQLQAQSLRATIGVVPWGTRVELYVFDDHSQEYGEAELREWYPMATRIIINDEHMGVYVELRSTRRP